MTHILIGRYCQRLVLLKQSVLEIIRDLRALQAIKLKLDGKAFLLRSDFEGTAHRGFMAAGLKPHPLIMNKIKISSVKDES